MAPGRAHWFWGLWHPGSSKSPDGKDRDRPDPKLFRSAEATLEGADALAKALTPTLSREREREPETFRARRGGGEVNLSDSCGLRARIC